jgi:signal transduction histidine kinase
MDAPFPVADAFRGGRALWIGCDDYRERYPALAALSNARAVVAIPVDAGGRALGAIGFGFDSERAFAVLDRALVEDLARQVGRALDRARLYEDARSSEATLIEASRRKDDFLALLGHELRNPLAPILTALEVLKLRRGAQAEPWRELDVIERQVRHLHHLVDDMLDVSRITQGKLVLKKAVLELDPVLALAVELAGPMIEQRRHRLTVESSPERVRLEADSARLAQAIGNLLGNAAKYTDEGGSIALRARREGAQAVIEVSDDGAGLPPEMAGSIFDPFVQIDRTVERAQGGLGLGLALVKSVVELHGGSVEVESEGPGRGSLFRVRLPALVSAVDPPQKPSAQDAAASPRGQRVRRVLIVDDNHDAADSLAAMLGLLGHQVLVAYGGEEALAMAREVELDVALLDIDLPGMDGYEVARRLGQQPHRPNRIVAVTGFGSEEDHRRSRAAGFVAHLVKPIDHDLLLRLLDA